MRSVASIFFIGSIIVASAQETVDDATLADTSAPDAKAEFPSDSVDESASEHQYQGQVDQNQPSGFVSPEYQGQVDQNQPNGFVPPEYQNYYYGYNQQYYQQYPQQYYQQYAQPYLRAPAVSGVDYNYLKSLNGELPPYDPNYLATNSGYYVPVYMDDEPEADQNYEWVDQEAVDAAAADQSLQTDPQDNAETTENKATEEDPNSE